MAHSRDGGAGGAAHAAWHSHWAFFLEAVPTSRVKGIHTVSKCACERLCLNFYVTLFQMDGLQSTLFSQSGGYSLALWAVLKCSQPEGSKLVSSKDLELQSQLGELALALPPHHVAAAGRRRPPSDPGSGWAEELGEGWDGWGVGPDHLDPGGQRTTLQFSSNHCAEPRTTESARLKMLATSGVGEGELSQHRLRWEKRPAPTVTHTGRCSSPTSQESPAASGSLS